MIGDFVPHRSVLGLGRTRNITLQRGGSNTNPL
jgi:hypothetical protein